MWLLVLLLALLAGCGPAAVENTTPTSEPVFATTVTPTKVINSPEAPTQVPASTDAPTQPATTTPEIDAPTPVAAPVAGFADGLMLATGDAALVIYYPGSGQTVTLLEPGLYDAGGDNFLIPLVFPPRFAPDGQRLIVATPADGAWLVGLDGSARQFHPEPVFATWSGDGQHAAFTGQIRSIATVGDGDVFVVDPAGGGPAEPLAQLPGQARSAVWSPGCRADQPPEEACGRTIAVTTQETEGLVLWLLDSETGEARQLGHFRPPPIGGTLWHQWTADGAAVIAQADSAMLAFPLDGSGPRPLVFEEGPMAAAAGELSPTGTLYARLEREEDVRSSLIVGSLETGQEVKAAPSFSQGEAFFWSGDGRYLLVRNYGCQQTSCGCEVWAVDTSEFPQLDEAILLAEANAFLGPLSALQAESTEVDTRPWAAIEGLPAAGLPATWSRHALPEAGLGFTAPAGWRVRLDGDAFTVANYTALTGGIVALPDEYIRIDGRWSGDFGNTLDYGDLAVMQDMHFNWEVAPVQVDGRPGVILRDRIAPVCDHVLLPHAGGELEITYCPATENWRAWMLDFLAGLTLEP